MSFGENDKKKAALCCLAYFINFAVISLTALFPLIKQNDGNTVLTNIFPNLIFRCSAYLLPVIFLFLFNKEKTKPPKNEINIFSGIVLSIFGSFGITTLFSLFFDFLGFEETKMTLPSANSDIVIYALFCVVLPAIFEEIIFRKCFIGIFGQNSRLFAVLFSSVLFSLSHHGIRQIIYSFFAGLFLGILFYLTNSVLLCIISHFLNNFLSYILLIFPDFYNKYKILLIVISVFGIISLVTECIILIKISKKEKTNEFRH